MPDNINSNTDPEMSLLTMQRGHGEKNPLSVTIKREATVRKRENTPTKLLCHVHYGTFALSSCLSPRFLLLAKAAVQSLTRTIQLGKKQLQNVLGWSPGEAGISADTQSPQNQGVTEICCSRRS